MAAHSSSSSVLNTKEVRQVLAKLVELDERVLGSNGKVPWIRSPAADTFFGCMIVLNAAWMGLEVELSRASEVNDWHIWGVEVVFLLIFMVELSLRLHSFWPAIRAFFDSWGIFDFIVTTLGAIDCFVLTWFFGIGQDSSLGSFNVLRVLRLARLMRLVRLFRMFSQLLLLVQTLQASMRSLLWMLLFLGMIVYTGSILCLLLMEPHQADDPEIARYWGTLGDAVFSHMAVVTLEEWSLRAHGPVHQNWLWSIYFIVLIGMTNMAIVNLIVGAIVDGIMDFAKQRDDELTLFITESEQFYDILRGLVSSVDAGSDAVFPRKELRDVLKWPEARDIMDAFGINIHLPDSTLHVILDLEGDDLMSFDEFYENCLRLCGSKKNQHCIFVQQDINTCRIQLREMLQRLQGNMEQVYADEGKFQYGTASSDFAAGSVVDKETTLESLALMLADFNSCQKHLQCELAELIACEDGRISSL